MHTWFIFECVSGCRWNSHTCLEMNLWYLDTRPRSVCAYRFTTPAPDSMVLKLPPDFFNRRKYPPAKKRTAGITAIIETIPLSCGTYVTRTIHHFSFLGVNCRHESSSLHGVDCRDSKGWLRKLFHQRCVKIQTPVLPPDIYLRKTFKPTLTKVYWHSLIQARRFLSLQTVH